MPETQPSVIELENADIPRTDFISHTPIIRDANWRIHRGDFWAVGALPGMGKTDLLSTASGLQKPMKGSQYLFGKNTAELNEEELIEQRLKIGMVFTNGRLFLHLTVVENLELPLAYHFDWDRDKRKEVVSQTLEVTGLSNVAQNYPSQVTRNLHQRVALARALALAPEVLLIDSPLVGIDPAQRRWWLQFLPELNQGHPALNKKPITIALATDDLRPWKDTARQFAVVHEKRFEPIGERDNLKPSNETVLRELLA